MLLNWILFFVIGVLAYIGISLMGQLSGGAANSALQAGFGILKPYALIALLLGNGLWGVALYFGLQQTKAAIPALIAVGVITGFVYSAIFLETEVTALRLLGLAAVLLGIYLLA